MRTYSLVIWWERHDKKRCVSKIVATNTTLEGILAVYRLYDPAIYDREIWVE